MTNEQQADVTRQSMLDDDQERLVQHVQLLIGSAYAHVRVRGRVPRGWARHAFAKDVEVFVVGAKDASRIRSFLRSEKWRGN